MAENDQVTLAEIRIGLRAIEAQLSKLEAKLDDDLEPIVRARAADRLEVDGIKRDIAASHDKHRTHFEGFRQVNERIDRVEQRHRSIAWALFGALFAAEALLRGLPNGYLLKLFGGP
jgi:hypothetical protein